MLHHGNCNISLQQTSARDTYNFSSCENGAFLIVEATVCCPFYYWSEIKVVRTKIVMQSAYTSAIERSIEMEWAWLRRFNALRCNWVMLLSCDCVLKFDWYCQLSGSGSNSLNSQKLPGHFSYGLGTRLEYCVAHTNHISPSLQLIPQLLCCMYLSLAIKRLWFYPGGWSLRIAATVWNTPTEITSHLCAKYLRIKSWVSKKLQSQLWSPKLRSSLAWHGAV